MTIEVHNEWDPLERLVIGIMSGARVPSPDLGLYAIEYMDYGSVENIPSGPFSQRVIEETAAELEAFADTMKSLGIEVERPTPRDLGAEVRTPDWSSTGFYDYCPRDGLLVVGDMVIETPMVLRSRFLEGFAYKDLMLRYLSEGARWISAPKPRLLDDMYRPDQPAGKRLANLEPAFDAANVLKFGTDILYLVSDSGNQLGAAWLQSVLGDRYTVHACEGLYASTHVDSTIVPIAPGRVLLNPERVNDDNLPGFLSGWEKLYAPPMVDTGYEGAHPYCSTWIGMNLLVLEPNVVVVDRRQTEFITFLEAHGVQTCQLQLTHCRTLGGGFHCSTLDTRRRGTLETYR